MTELEQIYARTIAAERALADLKEYAGKTLDLWDKDQESKVGKRLMWMSGKGNQGYEPDLKHIHTVSAEAVGEIIRKAAAHDAAIDEYGDPEADERETIKQLIEHYLRQMDQACNVAGEKAEEADALRTRLKDITEKRDALGEKLIEADVCIESLTTERDEARHRFGVAVREQMKTFAEKPNFMTFVQLKHGVVGDILRALQDGCITMGKACEALAEVAHGAEPTFAKSDVSPLADDVLPAEEIAKLTAERDGLAGMVGQMREALKVCNEYLERILRWRYQDEEYSQWRSHNKTAIAQIPVALALTLPAAVAEVAGMREKAAKWDEVAPNLPVRCTCHEGYTSRKLTDPDCRWCDIFPCAAKEAEDAK